MAAYNPFGSKHFVRDVQGDVTKICEPLFKQLGLNYFHYFRAYKDGTAVILYNRMDWSDYFYEVGFKPQIPLPNQQIQLGKYNLCLLKELEILQLLCRGMAVKEIAKQLGRSPRTVEMHTNNLRQKLGCYRKSELVAIALDNNISPV